MTRSFTLTSIGLIVAAVASIGISNADVPPSASAIASNRWSFSIDPSSSTTDLEISDLGDITYGSGVYQYLDGTASAGASSVPWAPGAAPESWTGYQSANSSANAGVFGGGFAGLGNQQSFLMTNDAPSGTLTIDLASVVGISSSAYPYVLNLDFAEAQAYGGVEWAILGHTGALWEQSFSGYQSGFGGSGDYSFTSSVGAVSYYTLRPWSISLVPGQQVALGFYANAQSTAVSPTPGSLLTLSFGLAGLVLTKHRRRSS